MSVPRLPRASLYPSHLHFLTCIQSTYLYLHLPTCRTKWEISLPRPTLSYMWTKHPHMRTFAYMCCSSLQLPTCDYVSDHVGLLVTPRHTLRGLVLIMQHHKISGCAITYVDNGIVYVLNHTHYHALPLSPTRTLIVFFDKGFFLNCFFYLTTLE